MFKNIIVPIDLADKKSIQVILPKALTLATIFNAKLNFVYIISDFAMKMVEDYLSKDWGKEQKEKYRTQVQQLIKQHIPDEIEVDYYIGRGPVYDEIIKYSNDIRADLIIISAVRPQLRDYMLGSNASKIIRHASTNVLVIRE